MKVLPRRADVPSWIVAGGIVCYDVSSIIPRRRPWPKRPRTVEAAFVHHSGALGPPGFDGIVASARFATASWGREWIGFPYHLWVPHQRLVDAGGDLVCYQGNPFEARSWHTGGRANGLGVSVALQGNTSKDGLSAFQVEVLEGLLPALMARFSLVHAVVVGHCESKPFGGSGKRACPGDEAMAWLRRWRGERPDDRMAA